jgi:hypothetical protein
VYMQYNCVYYCMCIYMLHTNIQTYNTTPSTTAGELFSEKIIMRYEAVDSFSVQDIGKMIFICSGCFAFLYGALYFCRRKRCAYCQGKLVFSPSLCIKCVIVGAEVPDQRMLAAIEARGEQIQGKPPERFPGNTAALRCSAKASVKAASCLLCCLKFLGCRCCHSCCYKLCCSCCSKNKDALAVEPSEPSEAGEGEGDGLELEQGLPGSPVSPGSPGSPGTPGSPLREEQKEHSPQLDTPSKKKKKKGEKGMGDPPHSLLSSLSSPVLPFDASFGSFTPEGSPSKQKKRYSPLLKNPNDLPYNEDFIYLAVNSPSKN